MTNTREEAGRGLVNITVRKVKKGGVACGDLKEMAEHPHPWSAGKTEKNGIRRNRNTPKRRKPSKKKIWARRKNL